MCNRRPVLVAVSCLSCNDRGVDSVGRSEEQRLLCSVIPLVQLSRSERATGDEARISKKSDAQRTLKFLAALGLSALMGLSAVDGLAGSVNYHGPRGRKVKVNDSGKVKVKGRHGGSVKVNGSSGKVKGRYGSSYSW